jgi:SnoaL-like domain
MLSYNISDLLTRNLRDVFGENDPACRRAAIDELWAEDCVFYDPSKGAIRGRDAIDRIAGAVNATHPDFRYQMTVAPQEYCDAGMVPWISGRPGEAPDYS